jgi:hypothetical protein
MPKRIRSTPQGTDRAKSGSIQDVQEFEVRVDCFRAFQMKDGGQCVVVHTFLDIVDIPADANATLRLSLDAEEKRDHAEHGVSGRERFQDSCRQGVTTAPLRRRSGRDCVAAG